MVRRTKKQQGNNDQPTSAVIDSNNNNNKTTTTTTTTTAVSAAAAASDNKKNQTRIGSSFLSEEAMQNLCRALCPEIQFYKRFLLVGNLNQEQIHESIQELSLLCPMETIHLRNCSDIPTFPAMKITKRQYKRAIKKRFYKPY